MVPDGRTSRDRAGAHAVGFRRARHTQLKTPLSLLSTATETLQLDRVRSPDRIREYLETIHAEAARLSLLVQRVLEFSRVQQRRLRARRSGSGALVRETADALAHGVSNEGFTVDIEQEGDGP